MAQQVLIFGTEDTSALASFYLKNDSHYEPVAFCVDGDFLKETNFEGLPVVPFEEVDKQFSNNEFKFFASIYDNQLRSKKSNEIKQKGYELISYVSSKSSVFSPVGENCFIMEDNTIQPFVKVGNNIIMWSGNHIGHHSVIEDNNFLSSHVVVCGHCHIKSFCWIGVNSSIKDHIVLEEGTFVAMSSMVTKNTKPYKKYMGVPAKEYGDNYIQ